MTTREDFEKWYLQEYGIDISEHFIGDRYLYEKMQMQYMGYKACAAHYEAELLKRDALIAEKDKALNHCLVEHGGFTIKGETERQIKHALSLTHDCVRLKEVGQFTIHEDKVGTRYPSSSMAYGFDEFEIGAVNNLYTIVKGAEG